MKFLILAMAMVALGLASPNGAHAQEGPADQPQPRACSRIADPTKRLECFDLKEEDSVERFGSVSGRISVYSITSGAIPLPTKIYLIPLPLTDEAKQSLGKKSPGIPIYGFIQGVKQGTAAPNGDFRISHILEGRYLLVVVTDAFSMQTSGEGCERLSEGTLVPESGPSFLTRCSTTEIHGGEETSIFLNSPRAQIVRGLVSLTCI